MCLICVITEEMCCYFLHIQPERESSVAVPMFGEWDAAPVSEGYSGIFNKVREEKQSSDAPARTSGAAYNRSDQGRKYKLVSESTSNLLTCCWFELYLDPIYRSEHLLCICLIQFLVFLLFLCPSENWKWLQFDFRNGPYVVDSLIQLLDASLMILAIIAPCTLLQ